MCIRDRDDGDSSSPSGTSAAVELLSRLYAQTGDAQYAQAASRIVVRISGTLQQSPAQWPATVAALNRYPLPSGGAVGLAITAATASTAADALSTEAYVRADGKIRSLGDHDEIAVTVVVDAGYHINANPASFDYLIPTSLSIDGVSGVQMSYPAATLIKPQFAPDGLKVYEGTIALKGIAAKGLVSSGKSLSAALKVQACNDQVCLPPANLLLQIKRE